MRQNVILAFLSLALMSLLSLCSSESNPPVDRFVYQARCELTGSAATADVDIVHENSEEQVLSIDENGMSLPYTYEFERDLNYSNPDVLTFSGYGSLAPAGVGSLTVTVTSTWQSHEVVLSQTIVNDHPSSAMNKRVAVFCILPLEGQD